MRADRSRWRTLRFAWIIGSLVQAIPVQAQFFQGPYGPGGAWNVYEYVADTTTWQAAVDEATERDYDGTPGQLVDVLSARENVFVELMSGYVPVWIGLTDREGGAPPSISGGLPAPQESRGLPDPLNQGWAWTSSSAFEYQNWDENEPVDFRGAGDATFIAPSGRWKTLESGFGANEPIAPVLQPRTSADETTVRRLPYVIEYPVASLVPVVGIVAPVVPPKMPSGFPIDHGIATAALHVTDYRGDFPVGARIEEVVQTLADIASGSLVAESVSADYTRADFADPDRISAGGPFIKDPPSAFPSNVVGSIDRNFISTAIGTLNVPEDGIYTIQVRSSAGFGLQIGDATFQSVSGEGRIDATDTRTLFQGIQTGDADTRGVIELTRGDYEFRFFQWAKQAGAYWEITSAQGAHVNDLSAQWLALGDGRTLPERTDTRSVNLVGTATVVNALNASTGQGNLETASETVAASKEDGSAWVRTDITTVVLRDEDGICCGRPGMMLDDNLVFTWPINDPTTGGADVDVNNFSSEIVGQLTVDDGDELSGETIPITFGMFSSDGAQLQIKGESFFDAGSSASLALSADGDVMLSFPGATANSNTFGLIELTEGQLYDFQAIHFENRADAGFELWTALGQRLDGFEGKPFFPLGNVLDQRVLPANTGLSFVSSGIPGDFNRNGRLDAQDVELQIIGIQSADVAFDLDHDDQVNFADLEIWVRELRGTWMGDANLDGIFDSQDLVLVIGSGKFETGAESLWSEGDWNADGVFSTSDLVVALQDGGFNAGRRAESIAVPENHGATLWLLVLVIVSVRWGTLR